MAHTLPRFTRGLLPQAPGVQLRDVRLTTHDLALDLAATQPARPCPICDQPSTRIHRPYHRSVTDLPWAGRTVRIALAVRTFFCTLPTCPRRVVTERLPTVGAPLARKTCRLTDVLRLVGFARGGEGGSRLLERLGMAASPRTLLRLLRSTPLPPSSVPRVLGVDAWAFRRGRRFGTLLVDLERHRPIDLLPESSEPGFVAWLRAHPGTAIISRDRGEGYATGAQHGTPQAIQVADRWHMLKNRGDALQNVLARHTRALRQAAYVAVGLDEPAPVSLAAPPPVPPRRARPRTSPTLSAQQRWQQARYQRVQECKANGWTLAAIVRELKLSRRTARK